MVDERVDGEGAYEMGGLAAAQFDHATRGGTENGAAQALRLRRKPNSLFFMRPY